jgi:coenzyme F420-reducing hydrogenase beta subunit
MKTLLGYSLDREIRYKATAGGVGSSLLKYLFEHGVIHTAVSFDFDHENLKYLPKLIYSIDDYSLVGSIYHEINLPDFIKKNVDGIKGGFACFCLPCQSRAIRHVVEKASHKCYLLGLTCSSQQDIEATYYLLKRLNIKKKDVRYIRYRGNGWPSGVQIELRTGKTLTVPNNGSIWTKIFHSRLFILKKCFKCTDTLNLDSDISLADPWLKSLQTDIQDGKTLIMVNTDAGHKIWSNASQSICVSQMVGDDEAFSSQLSTINRKLFYCSHPMRRDILMKMNKSVWYRKLVLMHPLLFRLHIVLRTLMER